MSSLGKIEAFLLRRYVCMSKYRSEHAKILLVFALLQCHFGSGFDYAYVYWYKTLTVKSKIQTTGTQNRVMRSLYSETQFLYSYV